MKSPLVSIIVPTRNSKIFLHDCLSSIRSQKYKKCELIIVDNASTDGTQEIALRFTKRIYDISSLKKFKGKFSATFQRNFGVKHAKGDIVYYFDADMVMPKDIISKCVRKIIQGAAAVIISEESIGTSFWAKCKQIERRCYWGNDMIEAPRCMRKKVWKQLGGLDESIAGGGDDWDLHEKLKDGNFKISRIDSLVLHNEGNLTLHHLIRKRFLYGKDTVQYIQKRKSKAFWQYFPIRMVYIKNWKIFVRNPIVGMGIIFMRMVEYTAGALGIIYSWIVK